MGVLGPESRRGVGERGTASLRLLFQALPRFSRLDALACRSSRKMRQSPGRFRAMRNVRPYRESMRLRVAADFVLLFIRNSLGLP